MVIWIFPLLLWNHTELQGLLTEQVSHLFTDVIIWQNSHAHAEATKAVVRRQNHSCL